MDGAFNCSRWQGPEGLLNQRVCKITPRQEHLNLDFLTHLLPGYLQAIHDLTSSTTVTHLSSRDIALLPIPVPPIDVQRRLASTLNQSKGRKASAASHLSAAKRAIERFRQAVLAAACSGRLTADWRTTHARQPSQSAYTFGQELAVSRSLVTGKPPRRPFEDDQLPPLPESWTFVPPTLSRL